MSAPEQPLAGMRFIVAARQSRKAKAGENIEFPIEAQDGRAKSWGESQGGEYIGTAADFRSGIVAPWDRKNTREWVNESGDKIREYDAIVATKTDRISRGKDEDFSTIEAWAARNQKKLIIVGPDGGIQYPARHDSDFWQWTATKRQARLEWESIRERSMNRQADLRAAKKLSGGAIPFGYEVSGTRFDKTLQPTEEGWEWVPQIFERVKNGEPLAKIAQWLDSEDVKPRFSQNWSAKSIAQIIRNRTYAGERKADDYINGKRQRGQGVTRIEVQEIIDANLWLAANNRLDNAPRGGRRGPKNWEPALLTGSLFCGNCEAPMYRLKVRGGYVYYRCHGHLPNPKGCGTAVSESLLDSIVNEAMLRAQIWVPEWKFVPGEGTHLQAEIDKIRLKLRDLPTKGLSEDEEDAERAKLRGQRRELEEALKTAEPDRWEKELATKADGTPLTEADRWKDANLAGRRDILKGARVAFKWTEDREPDVTIVPPWGELKIHVQRSTDRQPDGQFKVTLSTEPLPGAQKHQERGGSRVA